MISRLCCNRSLWRIAFWLYFVVLTAALLWPQLALPPVMPRPDLVVHCVSFGLFGLLLCLWNPTQSRKTSVTMLVTLAAGIVYGGAAEVLQSIPALHRSAAFDDWGADVLGVLCGLAVYWAVQTWCLSRCAPAER